MRHRIRRIGLMVTLSFVIFTAGCESEPNLESRPAPPPRSELTAAERKEVRAHIEPSLKEIDIELERLSDEITGEEPREAFAEAHRRDLKELRNRIGRLRVMMEARRPKESNAYREMRQKTTRRLERDIEQIETLQTQLREGPASKEEEKKGEEETPG